MSSAGASIFIQGIAKVVYVVEIVQIVRSQTKEKVPILVRIPLFLGPGSVRGAHVRVEGWQSWTRWSSYWLVVKRGCGHACCMDGSGGAMRLFHHTP